MRLVFSRALGALAAAAALAADLGAQRGPTIAAASNLNFALPEIAQQFEKDRGERVELVFGASGALTRQIRDGAPFEMFLAADEEFPDLLSAAGLTRYPGVVYAVGRLVVFAPKGSPLTVDERLDGLARLVKSGRARRFAIANPEVAPYGRAAEAVLRKRGLWEPLRGNLVFGDNISQAAQFATTGNAAGGIIAYSSVLSPQFGNRGTYALLPDADYPPLRQKMVLMKQAGIITEHFYQYLQQPAARAVLRKHGFAVPE